MSGQLITFPVKEFFAQCPECGGESWNIQVDQPNVSKIVAFVCSDCDNRVDIEVNITFKEKRNK